MATLFTRWKHRRQRTVPAEVVMDYVMFTTGEDGDPQMYFPYIPKSFSLRVHLSE